MNKSIILIMVFFPCVAMQSDQQKGWELGEKLKNAGIHEVGNLVERGMYQPEFKTMKKASPDQVTRIKAHAMKVIAQSILKKSDDMLRASNGTIGSTEGVSELFEVSRSSTSQLPVSELDRLSLDEIDLGSDFNIFNELN